MNILDKISKKVNRHFSNRKYKVNCNRCHRGFWIDIEIEKDTYIHLDIPFDMEYTRMIFDEDIYRENKEEIDPLIMEIKNFINKIKNI